jgi:hypothetical protein
MKGDSSQDRVFLVIYGIVESLMQQADGPIVHQGMLLGIVQETICIVQDSHTACTHRRRDHGIFAHPWIAEKHPCVGVTYEPLMETF